MVERKSGHITVELRCELPLVTRDVKRVAFSEQFPADRANMRTFRTWKLRFAVGFSDFVIVPTLST